MSRMKILNAVEQEQFESPPVFNSVQRKQYFDFSSELLTLSQDLQTPTNQVCFLVSCGYCKAAKRFFPNRRCSRRDLDYVAQQLGFQPESTDVNSYSTTTRLRHERLILDFYGFRPFDATAKSFVAGEIEKLARSQLQPALILWRIVDSLVKEKIEIPGYYPLAELILAAVNTRKAELCAIIERALTARTREALDELLVQGGAGEDEPVPAKTAAYKLTLLKKLSQSTRPSKIKETITDLLVVQGVYRDFLPILSALDLNHQGIRYYANSVVKSEIFQMTRRSSEDRYLHLIAFITHQYFRLQDNLLDVLLNVLQTYLNTAQREHKEVCYRRREHWNEAVRKLIGYLDHSFLKILSALKQITDSAELDDAEKVSQIRALLAAEEPDRHQAEASLAPLKRDLESETDGEDYYGILEAKSVRIQNRISPILKALPFQGEVASEALLRAIQYFRDKDGVVDRGAPTEFLKLIEEKAVRSSDGDLRVSLYKALLFIHVMVAIKAGTLNLEHSYKYRTLDNYMIDRDRWRRAQHPPDAARLGASECDRTGRCD